MILLFFLSLTLFSLSTLANENDCIFQDSCQECLAADLNCAWCTDKKYDMPYRCLNQEQLLQHGCDKNMILQNDPKLRELENIPLSDFDAFENKATQVQPQKIFLKLIKSHTQQIEFTYRPAKNNPLDLYVLMDLTWTMRDDKETLVRLGAELSKALGNLTDNYRLGFGSYADKPIMPMIMPHKSSNPCASENAICDPTYSFKHHLPLTENIGAFVESVKNSRITANLDNLEGGLDGLMQVIVCPDIGWKNNARKIVLLATDGFLHIAGDGLLAGIILPNSKKCHLNDKGEYTASLDYDYPSLEEIYRELVKQKVSVIFAVTASVVDTYQQQSFLMKEISNVEILSADSSNILELIKKSYESFTKRTQFNDNSPSYIDLQYFTDCGGKYPNLRNINHCNNIEIGKEVKFYVNVTLTDYPENKTDTLKIRIDESTLNQYLDIEVEIQSPCPCVDEKKPNDEYGRFACSDNGFLHCGMCECDENWTGAFCSCELSGNLTTNAAIENFCRKPLGTSNELGAVCSNHGECDCGECLCFPGYNGKYCECPECGLDCDPERADCYCGKCVCKYGWSGSKCNCKDSIDECIAPSGEICSGHGHCQCGSCACDSGYKGNFCEIGSGKENMLCTFYEPCVTCLIERKLGQHAGENCTAICAVNGEETVTHAFIADALDADVNCLVRLRNEYNITCDHYFTYQSLGKLENYLLIQVNHCEPVNYAQLVGLVSLSTFLLGLLIIFLVWCCVRMSDRREYARFEEDQRNSVLNVSPLYIHPTRRYVVPEKFDESTDCPFS